MRPKQVKCQWCWSPNLGRHSGKSHCTSCDGTGMVPALTEADEKLVRRAAYGVMNAIAPDIDNAEGISARHWVEIILDADHLAQFGSSNPEEKKRLRQIQGLSIFNGCSRTLIHRWVRETV